MWPRLVPGGIMKLALVAIHIEPSPRALPLGPAMLASVLKGTFGEAIQTRVVDAYVMEPAEVCVARILALERTVFFL